MTMPSATRNSEKYDVVFDFDKTLVPDNTLEKFGKVVYGESGVKTKTALAACGLMVYH